MRLDKFLADTGHGTRTDVKKLIRSGKVSVNGQVVSSPDRHIEPESDTVSVCGNKVFYREFIYLMLNKPQNYISATWDRKLPTVIDLLPQKYRIFDPFPVGRLDIDTEGLLILTNDGKLSHELLSPKKHVPKTYFAILDNPASASDISAFASGIILDDGYKTLPAHLVISENPVEVKLTISEGKFHQVKRMFDAVGKKVIYLKRIKMNNLALDSSLSLGEFKELSEEELKLLKGL